jgi:molybdate transport repressor ModE-like protein
MNNGHRIDWDMFRLLLALAKTGSLRAAAIDAGVALNTMRTKIAQLEALYGRPLVDRQIAGSVLTSFGRDVVAIAQRAEAEIARAASLRG